MIWKNIYKYKYLIILQGGQNDNYMKLETQLFDECINRTYNCSITYHRINDYSVEIYTGYSSSYKLIHYTDGHLVKEKAIREALKFLRTDRDEA